MVMANGPDRSASNFGGKILLPPSALQKLSMLHISYPMLFELHNQDKVSHAGVLEFVAEEGRVYVPNWLMTTLALEVGDIIQVRSTDLPPGTKITLRPQSVDFLEISDPRAVLEQSFRGFACLTKGDIFEFQYNDQIYKMAVEAVDPATDKLGIVTMETDLSVEFATPVGYVEPERSSTSTPASIGRKGGPISFQGTMAESINYASIAPTANSAAAGAKALSSNFGTQGHTLKKGSKLNTPKPSTPVAGASTNPAAPPPARKTNGPQPLRLPEGKLFFGYDVKPLKKKGEQEEGLGEGEKKLVFQGQGQTLRVKKRGKNGAGSGVSSDAEGKKK